ncbi:hypothetical protein [Thermostaphylospora chromogena]|uniref:Uncharacterized protein n=1 Tax=Thermostaphylospora chromogena TaxID=35622 RepID=A0A1H0XJX8_9ACTN|nr:hypothetical protein [Thermostaphylospora chromogena]SDQ03202.1 hypothetical protein SAMN04489764_0021 [Thermostaphylospora chromogena]
MTTDDPIVAVMADVARLSQRLDQYGAQLDTTNHGTAELASRLDAIDAALTDLARTVTDLAEAVAAATKRDAAGSETERSDRRPDRRPWILLQGQGSGPGTPFAELRAWVARVLIPQYGEYMTRLPQGIPTLPECWPLHPAACNELWSLYLAWDQAFMHPDTPLREITDWHDRLLPGVLDRLAVVFRCGHHEQATPRL